MTIEEVLMEELKKEWSKRGNTERYLYLSDIDFHYLNKNIQKKIHEYESILKREDISLEEYLKAIKECLILCKFLETLQRGKKTANICPLDREENFIYQTILLNDSKKGA